MTTISLKIFKTNNNNIFLCMQYKKLDSLPRKIAGKLVVAWPFSAISTSLPLYQFSIQNYSPEHRTGYAALASLVLLANYKAPLSYS